MNIDLGKLSKLANMPIPNPEKILKDLNEIATHFDVLDNLDIKNIEPTPQVTGLKNVFREDKIIDTPPIHDSYFVTNAIINKNGQ